MDTKIAIMFLNTAKDQIDESIQLLSKFPHGETLDDVINQKVRNLDEDSFDLTKWITPIWAGEDK